MSGAPQAQATVQMDAGAAHDAVLSAIAALGGRVLADDPPTRVQFEVEKKSIWITCGLRLRYRCEATIVPSGHMASTVRVSSRLDWSNTNASIFLILCAIVIVFGVFIIGAVIVGWSVWQVAVNWPKEVSTAVVQGLGAGVNHPAAPAASFQRATPPSMTTAQPPPPADKPEEGIVHEQLRKLKELYDGGVLTDEEFAVKKAELLARL